MTILFSSCSPGHSGGNEIAFIRNGHLWTIDPSGTNAFQVVSEDAPVIGFSWSPDHHILVFRALDAQFAKTGAAKQVLANRVTGQISDAPSTINTIGVDGGTSIPVMLSSSGIQYSNPYWNTSGTRLLYRQESTTTPFIPGSVLWWVSQNDQPEGIAAKRLPLSYSLPSFSYIDSMTIGNSENGSFSSTTQGTEIHYLVSGKLPGHPLPATLERVLWQPAHAHPLILYAITLNSSAKTSSQRLVQLVTLSSGGQPTLLASCACTQFAWSPDGSSVLYSTGTTFTIMHVNTKSTFTIATEPDSVPYWSPNNNFLLVDGPHQLQLVSIATKKSQVLLTDEKIQSSRMSNTPVLTTQSLVQSVPNNIWASDSLHFLFLTRGRLHWGQNMLSPGLYEVTINSSGKTNTPTLVDTGNDTQVGWSYQDMNTSFLY